METDMQVGYDLIYLTACGLRQQAPSEDRVRAMDLEKVYALSVDQSLEAITCMALEMLPDFAGPLAARWKESKSKVLRKMVLFDLEREELLQWMEENKIWYLPLKGCVIQRMYPRAGMRQMADNDILFDPAFRSQVRDWFTERQYKIVDYNLTNQDVYRKDPCLNFEMHVCMFHTSFPELWARYWDDIRDRLLHTSGKNYAMEMTDEEFYLYIISHSFKHSRGYGSTLRSLMDTYVILREKEASMDWDWLHEKLEQLGLAEFETGMRRLQQAIFGQPEFMESELAEPDRKFFHYVMGTRVLNTEEDDVLRKIQAVQKDEKDTGFCTRMKYYWHRLIPDKSHYEYSAELMEIYKHPVRRRIYVVKRLFRGVFLKRKHIALELDVVRKKLK